MPVEVSRYVALEGIEGAGKTSIQAALRDRLAASGHEVLCVREPGGTRLGRQLRRVLLFDDELDPWTEALLFAADRAHLASRIIRPALERDAWVISDRSVYSSLAYQGAGRGLGMEAIRRINQGGLAGVWPGVVILLKVGPGAGLARQARADSAGIVAGSKKQPSKRPSMEAQLALDLMGTDRIGSSGDALLTVVAEAFDTLARQEADRFVVVDAEQPLDRVEGDVWRAIHPPQC